MQKIKCLPRALIIKEPVCSLFVVFCDGFGLLMTLEPRLILFVEPPALALQRFCCKVLLISALAIVEGVEECIRLNPLVQTGVVEDGKRLLGVVRGRIRVGIRRSVMAGRFRVRGIWSSGH